MAPRRAAAAALALLGGRAAAFQQGSLLDPYDCDVGLTDWESTWTQDKKTWCCTQKQRNCAPDHPYNCDEGVADAQSSWSYGQRVWCCDNAGAGCPEDRSMLRGQAGTSLFDCGQGAVADWTVAKTSWCCSTRKIGCPDAGANGEGEENKQSLQGDWVDKQGDVVHVRGNRIEWEDGTRRATVTSADATSMTMKFGGGEYHAMLSGGDLVWDVDDVWQRQARSKPVGERPPGTAGGEGKAKVDSVMAALDRDSNGHLDFLEINQLQKAAHADTLDRSLYEQLCREFGEDPEVGIGVPSLVSIYEKDTDLQAEQKFLAEHLGLVPRTPRRWAVPLLPVTGAAAAGLLLVLLVRRGPAAWSSRPRPAAALAAEGAVE